MVRRLTTHTLDGIKGWFAENAVDCVRPFNATDLATLRAAGHEAYAGRTVHVEAAVAGDPTSESFKYGVDDTQMGMWLFPNSDDPDVDNPGGNPATDIGAWVAVAPTKKMMALVACAGYELMTTEFDSAQTYSVNDCLTAPLGTTNASSGKLTNVNAVPYTNPVCGVCSKSRAPTTVQHNSHGVPVLHFYTVYLPIPV